LAKICNSEGVTDETFIGLLKDTMQKMLVVPLPATGGGEA
jgi:hypothetical protein